MTIGQDTMFERVDEVLDKFRPFLLRDGGDCELVDVEDGIGKLRLLGACGTCPSSTITLKAGIERALLEEVAGFVDVEQAVYNNIFDMIRALGSNCPGSFLYVCL